MKKFQRITATLAFATAALTLATGVQAQSGTSDNKDARYAPGSAYIDLGVGKSDFSLGNGIGIFGSDQGDTSYSLRAGRYYSDTWGLELGYTDLGSVNRAGGHTKVDGINLSVIGKLPLNPNINLLGKVGTTYSRSDVSSHPLSGVTPGSENGFGLSYGIGVEFAFTPSWSAALQYESQDVKFAGDHNDRIGNTTLSARYRF